MSSRRLGCGSVGVVVVVVVAVAVVSVVATSIFASSTGTSFACTLLLSFLALWIRDERSNLPYTTGFPS